MKKRYPIILSVTLLALILTACGGTAADLPDAVLAARQALSEKEDIPVDEIEVVSYSEEEWPNACLGLAEEDEMCAQVITPGYQVTLEANGEEYIFRTDETGDVIREETQE
jgi:hypothetical protein